MATGPRIKAQIAIIPDTKCELCEENEIRWKCFTCDEYQYMCHQCRKAHLKSKSTRDHKITSTEGSDKQEQIYGRKEDSDAKCNIHPSEDIQMYCKPCNVPICHDCIASGSHQQHKLVKVGDVIDGKQEDLSKIIAENEDKLSKFERTKTSLKKNQDDYSMDTAQHIEVIKSRNVTLKAKLDQMTSDAISKLQEKEKQDQQILKYSVKAIESDITELKKIIDKCKDNLTNRNTELIQFVTDVKSKADKYKACDRPYPLKPPDFITRDVPIQELQAIFGNLDIHETKKSDYEKKKMPMIKNPSFGIKIVSTFAKIQKDLIAAVSNNKVWIGDYTRKDVTLVTSDGDEVQTVKTDFHVYDLAVTQSEELLVTECVGNRVMKLGLDRNFVEVYEAPDEYCTRGITVTDNNNTVICLSNYKTKEDSKLLQLSPNGELMSTIQYHTDGKTPLYDNAQRVSSNRNGDIIVIDDDKVVVVVDKTGHRRFVYRGQRKTFTPMYTETDKYGHILISDRRSSVIHLLGKDGNFIQCILTNKEDILRPSGLSIDKLGRLWVCSTGNNKIMAIQYIEGKE